MTATDTERSEGSPEVSDYKELCARLRDPANWHDITVCIEAADAIDALDERDGLRAENEAAHAEYQVACRRIDSLQEHLDTTIDVLEQTRQELSGYKRDAERFEAIAKRAHRTHDYDRTKDDAHWFVGFYADANIRDFSAAIDAAMAKQEVEK